MDMMQSARNENRVERFVLEVGVQNRPLHPNSARQLGAELIDHLLGDVEPNRFCPLRHQELGRLAAATQRVQHLPAAKVDALDQRLIEEQLPVLLAPLVGVVRLVLVTYLVVVGPLPVLEICQAPKISLARSLPAQYG